MYCGECGSKISDDAKFCPACGAKTEKAASASAEASFFTAEESAKESPAPWTGLDHGPLQASRAGGAGDLGGQIKAVRARSRRKMPQLVLVVIVILALSSATAFAAMWAYRTFVAPQPAAVEQGNPEPADPYAGQKAVFDDVLTHYKSASDNGWPTTSYDDDLSNIS